MIFIKDERLKKRKAMNNTFQQVPALKQRKQKTVRALLLVAGTISLTFGAIGIVLPILSTTPFLLFSATCYLRSSGRMHK